MDGAMMGLVPALFGFEGRMRRRDFWFYTVLSNLALFVLLLLDVIVPQNIFPVGHDPSHIVPTGPAATGIAVMFLATVALMMWMAAAMLSKRLHDRGKSGFLALAALIPVAGWVWLFIECGLLEGVAGPNVYGPSPKTSD